jgi:thiamine-phosphate pyrophosphorylase
MYFLFPKVYPILDSSIIPLTGREQFLTDLGASLTDAGVQLLEYRNKPGTDAEILDDCKVLRAVLPPDKVKLILDDRADLVNKAGFDGVHLDAGDMAPTDARSLLGPNLIIGAFGGSDQLLPGILQQPADYLAIGPVFQTRTKQTDKAPIGIEGVRKLREQAGAGVILSAAAGITFDTAQAVLDAGATMVAVAEAIFRTDSPAAEFMRWIEKFG